MAIEEAIRAAASPVLGIQVPEPFFDPAPPWVITPTGSVRGLHAVAAVGIGYAMISHDRYSVRDEKGQMDADRFATVLTELLLDKSNVLISVGRDVFRDRIESTEKVLRQIGENPVVDKKATDWLRKGTLAQVQNVLGLKTECETS